MDKTVSLTADNPAATAFAPDWSSFREEADRIWAEETAEELRLREEVMPTKTLPFASPVTHPDIVIEHNVAVPMRDGTILRADIYRPKAGGKFPVILQRGPYDKTSTLDWGPAIMRHFAERGYVGIRQDVRGRFASQGKFSPFVNEIEDSHDTVEWAASQPWSNGDVGMMGISYEGFTSYCAAISQAPNLKCIYPAMIGCEAIFRDDRGILRFDASTWALWAGNPSRKLLNEHRIDREHLPLIEIGEKAGFSNPMFNTAVTMDYETPLPGEGAAIVDDPLRRINVPTYTACGWYDEVIESALDTWQKVSRHSSEAKLIIGPWHHNVCDMEQARIGKIATKEVESRRFYQEAEQFFAHHLKGEENALSNRRGNIELFVMGANEWRTEHEWPIARAVKREIFLSSTGHAGSSPDDGKLNWSGPAGDQQCDEYDYDPLDPVRNLSGYEIWTFLDDMGDRSKVQARADVLVFSSEPLEEDTEVTGSVGVTLYASSDAPDTDFIVNLVDAHPDGHTQYLTHGIVRTRYRNGAARPELLAPDEVYRFKFEMRPTSNLFRKGHRIQIEVTSSDFSRYARNQNVADDPGMTANVRTAHQSICHSREYPSRLSLPIIPPQRLDQ